ncbi:DUF1826 domain-containing protein [Winogradskyella sp.]|uniref:DUF1826 domain-containing protein n=1 Tax=Winogradskyella sp. TaxID=1883156 RepID=UPI00261BB674|nr:DUF1826 domain-containing protein [Winogradskyella sp.]
MLSLQGLVKTKKRTVASSTKAENGVVGTTPNILEDIHQKHLNITVYNRDISSLDEEIINLLKHDMTFDSRGDEDTVLNKLKQQIKLEEQSLILQDIQSLLLHFKKITKANHFRLYLATINTNMCRKFHMDYNSLRILCTYSGPGTLWLTEDNVNRNALDAYGSNECIVIDENKIKQAKTGAVLILKGAKYSKRFTKGVVHRSPTIEESGQKRLLLRIDIHQSLNA